MSTKMGSGDFEFTDIFIIDAVPRSQPQTAEVLIQRISATGRFAHGETLHVYRCDGGQDVIRVLDQIVEKARAGVLPLLHFDGHGSEHGFNAANQDVVGWNDIYTRFREINLTCGNNLFVSMGVCEAAHSFRQSSLGEPCPVHALLASLKLVPDSEAGEGICLFYETLVATGNMDEALKAIHAYISPPRLQFISTKGFLEKGFTAYVVANCVGEGLERRRNALLEDVQKHGLGAAQLDPALQKMIRETIPELRRKGRVFLHMLDNEVNEQRFGAELEAALAEMRKHLPADSLA